jgi:GntR family transcriptional regulator, rspAB operon transcriptional repressor
LRPHSWTDFHLSSGAIGLTGDLADDSSLPKLKDKAYTIIRNKIIACELMPGAVVDQNALMREIGVSKTPVREAVNALAIEGLLVVMPRRAVIVAPISLGDIVQIYTVRENVEPLIARLATPAVEKETLGKFLRIFTREKYDSSSIIQSDFQMHAYLAERTENRYLIRLMDSVLSQNMRIVVLGARIQDRLTASNHEHALIIERMLEGDAEGAEQAMREHIASAKKIAGMVHKIQL